MKYTIILTPDVLEGAKTFSRELFKISRPVNDQSDVTQYLFGWITHPSTGEVALVVDEDQIIPVHPEKDVTTLMQMLNNDATESELQQLADYVSQTNQVRFGDIIPSGVIIRDHAEMETLGWFNYPDQF